MSLITENQSYERGGRQKEVYLPEDVVEVPCPLCGGRDKELIYVEHESIVVSRCTSCALIYTSTRNKDSEGVYWGDAWAYLEESRLIFEGKAAHHRDRNYREEIATIERYKKGGRFLDVGCNMGMLLRLVKARGWDAVGVEPSPTLAPLARRHGCPIHNCFLHDVPASEERSFDVVALSDVFEHVCEPIEMLKDVARFLKDDGVLFVKVPNARWNLFKQGTLALAGRKPKMGVWDSSEHVVHYTPESLRSMLDRGGFEAVKVATARPVQIPIWQNYVGRYYAYPMPWFMDWRRHAGRALFYYLSRVENLFRPGSPGYLSPCVVAVARKKGPHAGAPAG